MAYLAYYLTATQTYDPFLPIMTRSIKRIWDLALGRAYFGRYNEILGAGGVRGRGAITDYYIVKRGGTAGPFLCVQCPPAGKHTMWKCAGEWREKALVVGCQLWLPGLVSR